MSLWAEHLGFTEDCFRQLESLDCVRRVRSLGEMNWKQFAANEIIEMTGHPLKYPVEVDRKGKVRKKLRMLAEVLLVHFLPFRRI